jgi:hypothetical protein
VLFADSSELTNKTRPVTQLTIEGLDLVSGEPIQRTVSLKELEISPALIEEVVAVAGSVEHRNEVLNRKPIEA